MLDWIIIISDTVQEPVSLSHASGVTTHVCHGTEICLSRTWYAVCAVSWVCRVYLMHQCSNLGAAQHVIKHRIKLPAHNVTWMARDCAAAQIKTVCPREATRYLSREIVT